MFAELFKVRDATPEAIQITQTVSTLYRFWQLVLGNVVGRIIIVFFATFAKLLQPRRECIFKDDPAPKACGHEGRYLIGCAHAVDPEK